MPDEQALLDRRGRVYTPAVSLRLKKLLAVIFALVALLGANSVYLVAITVLGEAYQNQFYMFMFLLHLMLGLGLLLPFLVFAFGHLATAYDRPNRRAVRAGVALLTVSLVLIVSGFVLLRFGVGGYKFEVRDPTARSAAYWAHVICPLLAITCYVTHRMAGPIIKWRWAGAWAVAVGVFVLAMGFLHRQDPRIWYAVGPKEGEKYFEPSSARTATGKLIPEQALLMDQYCQKCHADAYEQHYQSVHHFSSFSNKPYLFSVSETREVALKRDGTVQASRWCAGCHDPVPFFSGRFDDPKYDIKDMHDPTTQAGLTCTVCHGITHINSVAGNAAYTIDEPMQYPFAYSDNEILHWINNQLIKAKPAMHKKTFLKDFHRSEEFCSVCHKVSLPYAVTHYKDWLRGQNHYDAFVLSGVSGHSARSFYYPDKAKDRCADCHMPLAASDDFGARDFDSSGTRKIHNHFFFGANTGLPFLRNHDMLHDSGASSPDELSPAQQSAYRQNEETIKAHQEFLRDGQMRIDIFAIKPGGEIDGELIAPLRPAVPTLEPGRKYLVEVVLRTLKLGHLFTQGTIDSNEVWVDFEARAGDRAIGRSGGLDPDGRVDPWSHFVNSLVVDRNGDRIDRRNPQDIYVPAYDHQLLPGSGQVVHYLLEVPPDVKEPVQLTARLQYRKFDRTYMEYVYEARTAEPGQLVGLTSGKEERSPPVQAVAKPERMPLVPNLPITTLCQDTVSLPVQGVSSEPTNSVSKVPEWQRWNDYGIGLLLEGLRSGGSEKGELRQAEQVFRRVVELGRGDGYANLARIYLREKRLADAVSALQAASQHTVMFPASNAGSGPGALPGAAPQLLEPAPAWSVAWLTGEVNRELGNLDEAIGNYELIMSDEMRAAVRDRGFDFRRDYEVWNALGLVRAERAEQARGAANRAEHERWLREALAALRRTLAIDPENMTAHFKLSEIFATLAAKEADVAAPQPKPADEKSASRKVKADELRELATNLADPGRPASDRMAAADALAAGMPAFLTTERDRFESKHAVLVDVLGKCSALFPESSDVVLTDLDRSTSHLLHVLHRELHKIYKLDDNARAAVALHRLKNPAADHAAPSIVIYDLHRPGAPGLAESPAASEATTPTRGGL